MAARPRTPHSEILYEIDTFEKGKPEPFQADMTKVGLSDVAHETVIVRGPVGSLVVEVVSGHAMASERITE